MAEHKQDCTRCPYQGKCWNLITSSGRPLSARNVVINMLVCRLQLGIKKDEAAKLLIDMYRPGMLRLIHNARTTYADNTIDINQAFYDISSAAVELMQHDYRLGDRGRLTPYLFDIRQGFLTKWVKWYFSRNRKFYAQHELYAQSASNGGDENEDLTLDDVAYESSSSDSAFSTLLERQGGAEPEDQAAKELVADIINIIEDGITLNSNEYRVMKFCLSNGNEMNASRHIDGLHIYLADIMDVSRPRCTRLYKRARQKVLARLLETRNE